jgi:hypothetical protein
MTGGMAPEGRAGHFAHHRPPVRIVDRHRRARAGRADSSGRKRDRTAGKMHHGPGLRCPRRGVTDGATAWAASRGTVMRYGGVGQTLHRARVEWP